MRAVRPKIERSLILIQSLLFPFVKEISASFRSGDEDLDDFVRSDALRLQSHNVARTYVARYDGSIVGYVTLLTDAVILDTRERAKLKLTHSDHPVIPALKIARLAVDEAFRKQNSGMGRALIAFAFVQALSLAKHVGCRLLTLDAYPNAVGFYEKLGFVPNKAKEYRQKNHPSMRLDVFAPEIPDWVTAYLGVVG